MGINTTSQKIKKKIKSLERNVPNIPTSEIKIKKLYDLIE
jgi:hypothetical protein